MSLSRPQAGGEKVHPKGGGNTEYPASGSDFNAGEKLYLLISAISAISLYWRRGSCLFREEGSSPLWDHSSNGTKRERAGP